MNEQKARLLFVGLALVSLVASLLIPNRLIGVIVVGICMLTALAVLYFNLDRLTNVSNDSPKMKTVRRITIMNILIILLCVLLSVLMESRLIQVTEQTESYAAATVVMVVLVFFGNAAPQIPHNRHTGLRLPWTVADEETWIIAHRILGYLSLPLAIFFLAGTVASRNVEAMVVLVVALWVGIPGVISGVFYYRKYRGM